MVKAGDLHDVGKLGIPDEIITKPGPLNEQEWAFMKQHTVMGQQIIAAAGPSLERIGPLVRASHERWDGMGYPDGLVGEEIPLGARIIAICDSFRAMMDERVYKPRNVPRATHSRSCAAARARSLTRTWSRCSAAWSPNAPNPDAFRARPANSPPKKAAGRSRGPARPRLDHAAVRARCGLRRADARRNASTTVASNWVPAQRESSRQASSWERVKR